MEGYQEVTSCRYKVEREIANEMCPPDGALCGMLRLQNCLVELEQHLAQRPRLLPAKDGKTRSDEPMTVRFTESTSIDASKPPRSKTASTPGGPRTVTINVFDTDNVRIASDGTSSVSMLAIKTIPVAKRPAVAASHDRLDAEVDTEVERSDRTLTSSSPYSSSCAQPVRLCHRKYRPYRGWPADQERLLQEAYADLDTPDVLTESESNTSEEYSLGTDTLHTGTVPRVKLYSPLGTLLMMACCMVRGRLVASQSAQPLYFVPGASSITYYKQIVLSLFLDPHLRLLLHVSGRNAACNN